MKDKKEIICKKRKLTSDNCNDYYLPLSELRAKYQLSDITQPK